jgi:hypothetical protein
MVQRLSGLMLCTGYLNCSQGSAHNPEALTMTQTDASDLANNTDKHVTAAEYRMHRLWTVSKTVWPAAVQDVLTMKFHVDTAAAAFSTSHSNLLWLPHY